MPEQRQTSSAGPDLLAHWMLRWVTETDSSAGGFRATPNAIVAGPVVEWHDCGIKVVRDDAYQVTMRALRKIATSPPSTPGQPRDPAHARMVEIAQEALDYLYLGEQ